MSSCDMNARKTAFKPLQNDDDEDYDDQHHQHVSEPTVQEIPLQRQQLNLILSPDDLHEKFHISESLLRSIYSYGIENLSEVQKRILPQLLERVNEAVTPQQKQKLNNSGILIKASSCSGKTTAITLCALHYFESQMNLKRKVAKSQQEEQQQEKLGPRVLFVSRKDTRLWNVMGLIKQLGSFVWSKEIGLQTEAATSSTFSTAIINYSTSGDLPFSETIMKVDVTNVQSKTGNFVTKAETISTSGKVFFLFTTPGALEEYRRALLQDSSTFQLPDILRDIDFVFLDKADDLKLTEGADESVIDRLFCPLVKRVKLMILTSSYYVSIKPHLRDIPEYREKAAMRLQLDEYNKFLIRNSVDDGRHLSVTDAKIKPSLPLVFDEQHDLPELATEVLAVDPTKYFFSHKGPVVAKNKNLFVSSPFVEMIGQKIRDDLDSEYLSVYLSERQTEFKLRWIYERIVHRSIDVQNEQYKIETLVDVWDYINAEMREVNGKIVVFVSTERKAKWIMEELSQTKWSQQVNVAEISWLSSSDSPEQLQEKIGAFKKEYTKTERTDRREKERTSCSRMLIVPSSLARATNVKQFDNLLTEDRLWPTFAFGRCWNARTSLNAYVAVHYDMPLPTEDYLEARLWRWLLPKIPKLENPEDHWEQQRTLQNELFSHQILSVIFLTEIDGKVAHANLVNYLTEMYNTSWKAHVQNKTPDRAKRMECPANLLAELELKFEEYLLKQWDVFY